MTVAREALGAPTISGASRLDVAYATGFVHGQDRLWQMDFYRRIVDGRLSEFAGPEGLPLPRWTWEGPVPG